MLFLLVSLVLLRLPSTARRMPPLIDCDTLPVTPSTPLVTSGAPRDFVSDVVTGVTGASQRAVQAETTITIHQIAAFRTMHGARREKTI